MTPHTLFPFCRRSHSEYDLVPEFPLFLPCSFLSRLLPRPSPSAFLIPQQSGIPLQARLQAHRPTLEGKPQGPRLPRSSNAVESCPFYICIIPRSSVLKLA